MTNGAALSGCEPYVFSTMQWRQLESERMNLLRRAFAREAYNHTDKLRTLSDNTLRRRLKFPTLESVTRKRRSKSYHAVCMTTLFGSFGWRSAADVEPNGSVPCLLSDNLLTTWRGFFLLGQALFGVWCRISWSTRFLMRLRV